MFLGARSALWNHKPTALYVIQMALEVRSRRSYARCARGGTQRRCQRTPMPDKTPLELADIAERMGMACPTTQNERVELAHGYMRVAAALIEQMTPVEATVAPTLLTGAWLCGGCLESVDHQQKFCAKCGVPIAWNQKAPR